MIKLQVHNQKGMNRRNEFGQHTHTHTHIQTHLPRKAGVEGRLSLSCDILIKFSKKKKNPPKNCYFIENSLPTTRNSPS